MIFTTATITCLNILAILTFLAGAVFGSLIAGLYILHMIKKHNRKLWESLREEKQNTV